MLSIVCAVYIPRCVYYTFLKFMQLFTLTLFIAAVYGGTSLLDSLVPRLQTQWSGNETAMATSAGSEQQDCFKEEFKRYKKRSADLRDIIDFRHPEHFVEEVSS